MLWYSRERMTKTDMEENELLNKVFICVFFTHKKSILAASENNTLRNKCTKAVTGVVPFSKGKLLYLLGSNMYILSTNMYL